MKIREILAHPAGVTFEGPKPRLWNERHEIGIAVRDFANDLGLKTVEGTGLMQSMAQILNAQLHINHPTEAQIRQYSNFGQTIYGMNFREMMEVTGGYPDYAARKEDFLTRIRAQRETSDDQARFTATTVWQLDELLKDQTRTTKLSMIDWERSQGGKEERMDVDWASPSGAFRESIASSAEVLLEEAFGRDDPRVRLVVERMRGIKAQLPLVEGARRTDLDRQSTFDLLLSLANLHNAPNHPGSSQNQAA